MGQEFMLPTKLQNDKQTSYYFCKYFSFSITFDWEWGEGTFTKRTFT